MWRTTVALVLGTGLAIGMFGAVASAQTAPVRAAPPVPSCDVDPNTTADPAAVAAAQRAILNFYISTNLDYSVEGYNIPAEMRVADGQQQSDWLERTLPLACGRLVGGYRFMNWVPGIGWQHAPAPERSAQGR
jgi:hypothetical protein